MQAIVCALFDLTAGRDQAERASEVMREEFLEARSLLVKVRSGAIASW
uniref:Uncharacterized protein n=1 Tax=Desertifilum tharense IPPAS B-1220 TaxID=1781255 RepID=A0ACD5GYF0_9CYAN